MRACCDHCDFAICVAVLAYSRSHHCSIAPSLNPASMSSDLNLVGADIASSEMTSARDVAAASVAAAASVTVPAAFACPMLTLLRRDGDAQSHLLLFLSLHDLVALGECCAIWQQWIRSPRLAARGAGGGGSGSNRNLLTLAAAASTDGGRSRGMSTLCMRDACPTSYSALFTLVAVRWPCSYVKVLRLALTVLESPHVVRTLSALQGVHTLELHFSRIITDKQHAAMVMGIRALSNSLIALRLLTYEPAGALRTAKVPLSATGALLEVLPSITPLLESLEIHAAGKLIPTLILTPLRELPALHTLRLRANSCSAPRPSDRRFHLSGLQILDLTAVRGLEQLEAGSWQSQCAPCDEESELAGLIGLLAREGPEGLRHLGLQDTIMSGTLFSLLAQGCFSASLESLRPTCWRHDLAASQWRMLGDRFTNLRSFSLWRKDHHGLVAFNSRAVIDALCCCTKLERVELEQIAVTDADLRNFGLKLPVLSDLRFRAARLPSSLLCLQLMPRLQRLVILCCRGSRGEPRDFACSIPHGLKRLEILQLHSPATATNAEQVRIGAAAHKELEHLAAVVPWLRLASEDESEALDPSRCSQGAPLFTFIRRSNVHEDR